MATVLVSLTTTSLALSVYGWALLKQIEAFELSLARRAAAARRPA